MNNKHHNKPNETVNVPYKLQLPRPPPNPPKYLVVTTNNSINNDRKSIERREFVKPTDKTPIKSTYADDSPIKRFTIDNPSDRYQHVDSKNEYKKISSELTNYQSNQQINHINRITNNHQKNKIKIKESPMNEPKILKPFITNDFQSFMNQPLLLDRKADGKILGSYQQRYISSEHIPNNDIQVNSSNPMKQIDDTWTAYWDEAAGAVYYYNHITGEATWIKPDI